MSTIGEFKEIKEAIEKISDWETQVEPERVKCRAIEFWDQEKGSFFPDRGMFNLMLYYALGQAITEAYPEILIKTKEILSQLLKDKASECEAEIIEIQNLIQEAGKP